MIPFGLMSVAAATVLPLALEIDVGQIPPATVPGGYRLRVMVTFASGAAHEFKLSSRPVIKPVAVRAALAASFEFPKMNAFWRGDKLIVVGYDGSVVSKVDVTTNGPKPGIYWVPKP